MYTAKRHRSDEGHWNPHISLLNDPRASGPRCVLLMLLDIIVFFSLFTFASNVLTAKVVGDQTDGHFIL